MFFPHVFCYFDNCLAMRSVGISTCIENDQETMMRLIKRYKFYGSEIHIFTNYGSHSI